MAQWHDSLTKKFQTRRGNKYGAQKVKTGGHTYDSKGEHEMHGLLQLMERGGLVREIIHHPPAIALTRFVNYKPDFRYFEIKRGIYIYVDFKGMMTERFRVVKNLWKEFGPTPLQVWMKSGNRIFLSEEIEGKRE